MANACGFQLALRDLSIISPFNNILGFIKGKGGAHGGDGAVDAVQAVAEGVGDVADVGKGRLAARPIQRRIAPQARAIRFANIN